MKPIHEAKAIQLEITNHCNMRCTNCSRFIGHYSKSYFMSLEEIEKALQSLEGFEGIVGVMGGEPTLHEQFREICKLYQKYIPKERRGLWTNGYAWERYKQVIEETFTKENILYNAHDYEYVGQHQPALIASKEIIKEETLRKELIDNCWVQLRWSPSINPKGAFFCEIAAAMEMLMNLGGGWKVEKGWWSRDPEDFQDQVDMYCSKCSMCIPLGKINTHKELISPKNLNLLFNNDAWRTSRFLEYNIPYSRRDYEKNVKDWKPGQFRDFEQHEPHERIYK